VTYNAMAWPPRGPMYKSVVPVPLARWQHLTGVFDPHLSVPFARLHFKSTSTQLATVLNVFSELIGSAKCRCYCILPSNINNEKQTKQTLE